MQDHQTVGTIYTLHDVTEDKQAQEALQDATAHAVQASKAKSTFLANMSHEIRTPLTAILGIAEILQDSDLNSDQRKMVQAFQNAGENLLAMINDLLDLSRIEAGKMPLVPRDFSAGELLSSICQLFRMKIASPSGNVQLNLQLDSSLPSRLRADDFRLSQILTNLIGNAVKFTAKGSIDVSASYADGLLEVTVEDTGPGIPGDRIEAVFTAFEQADASATRAFGGTGLGLAIVRELVRLMGGSVSVSSEPGKGSRFTVRLPAGAALAELSPESRPTPSQIELRHGGLLVAEDTEVIRTILIRHLTAIGVPAIFVENGKEAVAEFTHSHFDAVLLDIQMPVMDGFEAARIIRALERAEGRKKTPLIALSASAMPDDVVKAKQAGFDLHIAKPVSRIQLQQALQQALG
jgi:CheY-like chemotaxis protein/nitrogen-specific signal transduction histidine kinase